MTTTSPPRSWHDLRIDGERLHRRIADTVRAGGHFDGNLGGISHNVDEHTSREHVEAGANVLLQLAADRLMAGTK